ncbi:hypothetical protein [Flavobacterium sangjuense]|uniref:PsbP C-terminal domain-containing protein n=1 Tax=Flavobacterium sangjuense TaxID=2518177 RepID=A0A4P7PV74_9FLAO|nr:hypothetical protein [Flavobacterium sangjuense]QBZ98260.1 hypothetical protein GS03_01765 [Flavobacterium sangjuense]
MKAKFAFLILLLSSNFIFSQETNDKEVLTATPTEETENGKIENSVYTCYRFDWKIKIPMNYVITDVKKVEELQKKGLPGGIIAKPTSPHLIGFEVDKRNTFTAAFESLAGSQITSLEEHKNFIIKLMNDTYSNIETLKFDLTSADMKIGKYDFYKVQTRLYDPKTGELLLTQDLYNSFINNNLFSVNINFNNPNIGRLLTDNFISSLSN